MKFSKLFATAILFAITLVGLLAWAQASSQPTGEDVGNWIVSIVNGFQNGAPLLAVSTLITLATWAFNVVANKLKPDWLPDWIKPWIAAVLGMVAGVITALAQGQDIKVALAGGLVAGNAASGFWSLIAKHALTGKETKTKRVEARKLAGGQ